MEKEKEDIIAMGKEEATSGEAEDDRAVSLKKPITFEGKTYSEIDLHGMDNIKAGDMIMINRQMTRNGDISTSPELTLEYALNVANISTGIPLEFFEQLPPYAALALRKKVVNFLYGWE